MIINLCTGRIRPSFNLPEKEIFLLLVLILDKQLENNMKDTITFEDFLKLDIRVGQIMSAEPVPKSKKLLKLSVEFGTEVGVRTILAGIAGPDPAGMAMSLNLSKPKVLAVVNLAPRQMMGIESHGMLLASHDDLNIVWLTTVNGTVPNGSEVS